MTKKSWLALAVLALAGGVAQAQTWSDSESGITTTFNGCKTGGDGFICNYSVAYTGAEDKKELRFCTYEVKAVTTSGNTIDATTKRFGTNDTVSGCDSIDVYKGVPLKLEMIFREVPGGLANVARINYYGKILNVAAAPVSTSTPASTPAANMNIAGNWSATLSNCKQTAANTVVCTATLRK